MLASRNGNPSPRSLAAAAGDESFSQNEIETEGHDERAGNDRNDPGASADRAPDAAHEKPQGQENEGESEGKECRPSDDLQSGRRGAVHLLKARPADEGHVGGNDRDDAGGEK